MFNLKCDRVLSLPGRALFAASLLSSPVQTGKRLEIFPVPRIFLTRHTPLGDRRKSFASKGPGPLRRSKLVLRLSVLPGVVPASR